MRAALSVTGDLLDMVVDCYDQRPLAFTRTQLWVQAQAQDQETVHRTVRTTVDSATEGALVRRPRSPAVFLMGNGGSDIDVSHSGLAPRRHPEAQGQSHGGRQQQHGQKLAHAPPHKKNILRQRARTGDSENAGALTCREFSPGCKTVDQHLRPCTRRGSGAAIAGRLFTRKLLWLGWLVALVALGFGGRARIHAMAFA